MLPLVDVLVIIGYLAVVVGLGLWISRDSRHSEDFMAAQRSLPGWAVGLSIFGSYISSISFLANPGKSFASDWGAFVFSMTTPFAAWVAVRWFVPFYRASGHFSAYEHLEARFGPWARTYAVGCFLLLQIARMGTIVYLLALVVAPLTGWDVKTIILVIGGVMTIYTAFGGIKAAIWTGVLQSVILLLGPLICLWLIVRATPGGVAEIVRVGSEQGKFSLGSLAPDLAQPTFWVVLFYGVILNLQNFTVDQSYVQRYVTARSERDAARSVWIGAALYVPVAAFFFLVGTALYVLKITRPEYFPAHLKPDEIFPHFITHGLPVGARGLVIAALLAAAMDSNLSSMSTLTLCDIYKRYLRPQAGERESLRVLRGATLGWGVVGTLMALLMIRAKTVLDVWWDLAGVFGGGMLGLFLLGFISRKVTNGAAAVATGAGTGVILWMTFSKQYPGWFAGFTNPMHSLLTVVVGTLVILMVGLLLGLSKDRRHRSRGG